MASGHAYRELSWLTDAGRPGHCRWQLSLGQNPGLYRRQSELSISFLLLPDCGCHVTSYLKFLLWQTVFWNCEPKKPFLSYIAFCVLSQQQATKWVTGIKTQVLQPHSHLLSPTYLFQSQNLGFSTSKPWQHCSCKCAFFQGKEGSYWLLNKHCLFCTFSIAGRWRRRTGMTSTLFEVFYFTIHHE